MSGSVALLLNPFVRLLSLMGEQSMSLAGCRFAPGTVWQYQPFSLHPGSRRAAPLYLIPGPGAGCFRQLRILTATAAPSTFKPFGTAPAVPGLRSLCLWSRKSHIKEQIRVGAGAGCFLANLPAFRCAGQAEPTRALHLLPTVPLSASHKL